MQKILTATIALAAIATCTSPCAQGIPSSVFMEALANGESSTPLPDVKPFDALIKAIKDKTGSDGQVLVKAFRVARFKEQSKCGRVAFIVAQPSSGLAWDDLGGQLNICEDGRPPLKRCNPGAGLIPGTDKCPDGSTPSDTEEVSDAIKKALASGGLTHEQVKEKLAAKAPQSDSPKAKVKK